MHTDKDTKHSGPGRVAKAVDPAQEDTLRWLLDVDMSEPAERLFTVEEQAYVDTGLTDYEAEVASRPMIRGKAGADDYDTYVAEEIVISADTQTSDIYCAAADSQGAEELPAPAGSNESMAVDYSRKPVAMAPQSDISLEEGVDVLGLAEHDDMGEKFLVIKRVKADHTPETAPDSEAAVPGTPEPGTILRGPGVSPEEQSAPEHESAAVDEGQVRSPTADAESSPGESDGLPLLLEAPVLRLVSPAGDGAEPALPAVSGPERETTVANDVLDYIASFSPPADDSEFDDYLLRGEQLQPHSMDIDQLLIEYPEGVVPHDPDPALLAIDYHEDFSGMTGFDGASVANITPVIPQLMEEVSARISERLAELGMAEDSVRAELMLGSDQVLVEQCLAENFAPVVSICLCPLTTLQQLRQAEVDEIFIRLVRIDSGECCNQLFSDDFVAVTPVADSAECDGFASAGENFLPIGPGEATGADERSDFARGMLDTKLEDELAGTEWEPGASDIDAVFADLGQLEDEAVSEEFAVEQSAAPAGNGSGEFQVFDDNIFAGDLACELSDSGELSTNIDDVFDNFGQCLDDSGEICGLDVEQFSEAASPEQPTLADGKSGEAGAGSGEVSSGDRSWCIPKDIVFNHASKTSTEIFTDFLDAFIEEGSSELEKLEDAVGIWEKDVAAEPAFTVVTRILHTIKGIAKGVGLQYYGTLIHNFETLLDALPKPIAGGEADYFRIVNVWLDAAVRGLDYVQSSRADIVSEFPQQPSAAAAAADLVKDPGLEQASDTADEYIPVREDVPPRPANQWQKQQSKQLADEGARVLAAQQSVRITSDKLDDLLNLANQAQQLGVRTAQSTARGKRAAAEMHGRLSSVRAHIAGIADRALRSVNAQTGQASSELDALEMDQYTELQEAANILREGVEDLVDLVDFASRQNAQVEALLNQQTTVISSIGSSIRAARVVPVSRLVPGLRRLVRTVSNDLDKTVNLRVLNELGTLDRDDYARCQIILDHMVRNALDHGIESAPERLAAGKPATGELTIDIRKAGADAIITLADDGRGIDPEAMRDSACRKGLEVDVDALSDDEALRLIFHKGFSTASAVSQISGRGVGMDIVLSELQQMGGDVQIESTVGRGTAFHIRIPSSVTVNGALLVSAGAQSYAIPLAGLIAVEQLPVEEFFAAVENGTALALSGMECRPSYLDTLCNGGLLPDKKNWLATVPVIIAGSGARYMAIAVDDVEEALELVIRSLGPQFSTVPGVAGATTTAAGEAIVALDLNLLVARAGESGDSPVCVGAARDNTLLAMVVDDSRTQRMVATSQLETVGVETVTAENGGVAIDWLNSADRLPDVILLDVEMPVKDGIQTLREIRKSVRYRHVPVIMVTSRTGLKHRALAQEAGCNGYMGKPFNFRLLIGQINELTGHRLQLS